MEPIWPNDLLDTRHVMSCLTYHAQTHCINHKHCLLSLQRSHHSISMMSSVHHLCYWLVPWEHVFLFTFYVSFCNRFALGDWCQCLYNDYSECNYLWDVLVLVSAGLHTLGVPDESGVLDCSDVERTLFLRVHLLLSASACSISTNMLCSFD